MARHHCAHVIVEHINTSKTGASQGGWGIVTLASIQGREGDYGAVVSKTHKPGSIYETELGEELRNNLQVIAPYPSPHLVRFIGIPRDCLLSKAPLCLLFERWTGGFFELYGELINRKHTDTRQTSMGRLVTLVTVVRDAARGVLHLHMLGYVHGDLSAGNVLYKTPGHKSLKASDNMPAHIIGGLCDFARVNPFGVQVAGVTEPRAWLPENEYANHPGYDVYSLGVLMACVAKRLDTRSLKNSSCLVETDAKAEHRNALNAWCADGGNLSTRNAVGLGLQQVLDTARKCLDKCPVERPPTHEVVMVLENVVRDWQAACIAV